MDKNKINAYLLLAKEFKNRGFSLYMVGGTVRDYLFHLELTDMDLVSDATPEQIVSFLDDVDKSFMKYGSIKIKYHGVKFDITTLRIEGKYKDHRHPSFIKYTNNLKKDYVRRDFTINGLYMDDYFKIYDFCNGEKDIKDKVIRFIGKPKKRIKEDPLRILRAIRFALKYGCSFEPKTYKALKKYMGLLKYINKDKIKLELNKFNDVDQALKENLFNDFSIHQFIDVLE